MHKHMRPNIQVGAVMLLFLSLLWPFPGAAAQTTCPPSPCTPGNEVGRGFFLQVVEGLNGVAENDFAVDVLAAWAPHENTSACWNPLASTWEMGAICDFNEVGVQSYQDERMGVEATARTLNQGYYADLRAMLAREAFDREAVRSALGRWGTCRGVACDSLLNEWQILWTQYALDMRVVRQPGWPVVVEGDTLLIEVEVENTGSQTWKARECFLVNKRNPWGADPRLPLPRDVKHGETVVFSWTTAPFSSWGVPSSEWRLAEGEEEFGDTVRITAAVLPKQLADQKAELEAKLREWARQSGEDLEELVLAWIQEQFQRVRDEVPKKIWEKIQELSCSPGAVLPLIVLGAWCGIRRKKGRVAGG